MRRLPIFAVLLLALCGASAAADFGDPLPRYERDGNGFACRMNKADFVATTALHWDVDQPCMRIGPLYVGMPRADFEKILGSPDQDVTANGRENFVYVVHRNHVQEVKTFVAVTFAQDGTADSIQLTGQPWPNAWQFSGLTLGNSDDALRARLGDALKIEPSDEAGTLIWAYRPWTFSFEVHDKRISSIRAAKSEN